MYGYIQTMDVYGPWLTRGKDIEKIEYLFENINSIPMESVCDNPSPDAGFNFVGVDMENNTFELVFSKLCEGLPIIK